MKSTYLIRLMSLIIAVAVLAGCSKDDQLVSNAANTSDKMVKTPPIYTGGFITGQFIPAPDYAVIKVYNNEGYSREFISGAEGRFKIPGLPADIYNLMITYQFYDGVVTRTYNLEIIRVPVKEDEVTELGFINLPVILR